MNRRERGYFLVIAVVFILVIGLLGSVIAYLFSSRAMLSPAQLNGLKSFYMAESGLEIGTRLLTNPVLSGTPSRIACGSLSGTAAVTNAAIGSGTFTLTTVNSSPVYAATTLSGAVTVSATTIPLTNAASFAPSGRVVIDNEIINYADTSGNSLIGVTRGAAGSLASSHASGAGVGQYQCSVDSQAGIPNLSSPSYKRELQQNVQLQDGWVVANSSGSNFMMARWNRTTEKSWNLVTVAGGGFQGTLNSVSMVSNADGWAVGNLVSSNVNLFRWNGSSWTLTRIAACSNQHLLSVSMVSSREGWAVGARYRPNCAGSGNYRYFIMKWNGSSWSALAPPTLPADSSSLQALEAVHVIDTTGNGLGNIGFAVGDNGTILRYNGSTWVTNTSGTTQDLTGVFVVSTSEAWAVGASSTLLKWNGTSWSAQTPPANVPLNDIVMIDTDGDGLANVGWIASSSGRIYSYNGSTWAAAADIGGNNLTTIRAFNRNDVWAAGASGTILHWDGSTWATFTSPLSVAINGMSLITQGSKANSNWQQVFR